MHIDITCHSSSSLQQARLELNPPKMPGGLLQRQQRAPATACCGLQASSTAWPIQLLAVQSRSSCLLNAANSRRPTAAVPTQQQRAAALGALQDGCSSDDAGGANPAAPAAPAPHAPHAAQDRRQLWKAAIKLPMYSVGVVPVLVS
jgi:hypothetical protein